MERRRLRHVGLHIGPVDPAIGMKVVQVRVLHALDGIAEILLRGQQKCARQEQRHGALRVERENGIVDVHRLELQILGQRLDGCIHFYVVNFGCFVG